MGIWLLTAFVLCAVYVQMRGRVRHAGLGRKISDHANLFAPINCLFYWTSAVRSDPYAAVDQFPELRTLQENWETIRDEALALNDSARIAASDRLDDIGFNSFFRSGWKRFYLKWYGASLKSAEQLCPRTVALVNQCKSVKGAMFAMLPPGGRLVKHRDPYAGSLRYHLGLATPNSPDCYICVDGQKYHWRDGEAVMFDETFIHYAANESDSNRIILFLDVRRPVRLFLVDWFNALFSRLVVSGTASKNTEADRVGFINKGFYYLYQLRTLAKKVKAWNRPVYYTLKYLLYGGLVYWLFLRGSLEWFAGVIGVAG